MENARLKADAKSFGCTWIQLQTLESGDQENVLSEACVAHGAKVNTDGDDPHHLTYKTNRGHMVQRHRDRNT